MIAHNTVGPLARGTSVLDVMKNMVLSGSPYVLLEGAPLLMVDAEQILRRIASCDSAVEVLEVLRSDADELAYEVPIVQDVREGAKYVLAKDVGAVVMKGGSTLTTLQILADNKEKLERVKVEDVIDERPPLIDPLIDLLKALRQSLIYSLSGYLIVGQKRPFGMATPLKVLKYLTLESTISHIEMGDSTPLERAVGDLVEPLPNYPGPNSKLSDALQIMADTNAEVLPVVRDKKYAGVLHAKSMLLPLLG